MCEAPVFYATNEGQTRRIAERMAETLCQSGLTSRAIEIGSPEAEAVDWQDARIVMVGASLHVGRHQRSAEAFVRRHAAALNARPSVFFSVSLSICSTIRKDVEAAGAIARALPEQAGWKPARVVCLGGRLAYTQYGWLTRFMMRRIARKSGGPTDTSRDHELTNWDDVRAVAQGLAALAPRQRSSSSSQSRAGLRACV
jgi:menaquinone-dependent protoporphyrinogen oxidase